MDRWSRLNNELLCVIAEEKVTCLEDFIRLQAVCKNWRISLENSCFRRPQLPWLILPYSHNNSSNTDPCRRGFFSLLDKKVHNFMFPGGYEDKRCIGSCHGWLAMMDDASPAIFLVNAITGLRIELPPVTTIPEVLAYQGDQVGREYLMVNLDNGSKYTISQKYMTKSYMHKVVFSCDPMMGECIVVALWGWMQDLAFCRVGDQSWTVMHHETRHPKEDVVYWRGRFYTTCHSGGLMVCELESSFPTVTVIIEPNVRLSGPKYLAVDSFHDKLWLISRSILDEDEDEGEGEGGGGEGEDSDDDDSDGDGDGDGVYHVIDNNGKHNPAIYRTEKFEVDRLDEGKRVWEEMKDLGDNMLFLGVNQTVCLSKVDFPECKANVIYFNDDYTGGHHKGKIGGHDMGIFNMEDGTFETLLCCDPDSSLIWPPPGGGRKLVTNFEGNDSNRIKQIPLDRQSDVNNVKRNEEIGESRSPQLVKEAVSHAVKSWCEIGVSLLLDEVELTTMSVIEVNYVRQSANHLPQEAHSGYSADDSSLSGSSHRSEFPEPIPTETPSSETCTSRDETMRLLKEEPTHQEEATMTMIYFSSQFID